ncbi:metalloregulator ArsR/SmtB family transcription factor [Pelagibacterium flavum]|uniref:Metalloregulator ArsR/SmtB family transcription factor n=1 Tax=Pelagibacterium flavum TaxID=2984530 RepID=A0ABY6IN19_9HYPH|nr:metalloregulator ArsR/SmtB family transcription factor [Pelagibacterium sp. YIM 151497]MAN76352.1 transcriptional regulator [Hyphomicrobiales bacterium]UYQ71989.1 metalloregulator ArsR/SmtB family transcription factor [Pelagibacterium sp. YIM 151497]|tara:strand:+ start:969 stop:1298 length:330 start_codon:yes stop_codon:yes gene_type:complete
MTQNAELSAETRTIKSRVDEASSFLKKLANRDRLLVVCALAEGERSVRELEDLLDIRQPGLSQQLAELRTAGMIAGRKQGKAVYYHIADPKVRAVIGTMYELFCAPAGQ